MKAVNIEIATNLSCPRRCPGCNRSCDVYPERVEEMSLDQIDRFIDQMRRAKAEGRTVCFQMVTDDIYAISKGALVGRPR